MRSSGLRLGRILGVAVTLDWSLLIIFLLLTLTLSVGILPAWHPDWGGLTILLTAVVAAVLFLASVLVHELSHAVVGRQLGIRVRHITLFVFGGMAHMENEPRTWRAEFGMAIAGPLTSLALGFVSLYLAGLAGGPVQFDPEHPMKAVSALNPLATILVWLGPINILLGLFNMVPGFPLDGGRVLRAILWGLSGDLMRATRWAALSGRAVAWLLIASGFAMIFGVQVPLFGSGVVEGLWIALIGWFLNNAALMSYQRVLLQQTLGDLPVTRVMHRDFRDISPDIRVQVLVEEHVFGGSQRAFPVLEGDRLLGLVCLADVRRLEPSRRETTAVAEIMTPREALQTLSADAKASEAMDLLALHRVNQLPVMEADRLLGLVSREDILKWLSLHRDSLAAG
jgi:Zn-dependent protease/CBS domain-containing protein